MRRVSLLFALAPLLGAMALNAATAGYETRIVNGAVVCMERAARVRPRAIVALGSAPRILNPHANANALTIILRGTAQLDSYPEAKAAFVRAAGTWEQYLTNPITIYVDVDYGPTWFGDAYDEPTILGATNPASTVETYSSVAAALRASGLNQAEAQLYQRLPTRSLPTDIGDADLVVAPMAEMAVLGVIDPPAPTDTAPAVGFNSGFAFDFDRSDGIARDTVDFESVALHELGHVLGFSSRVGAKELKPELATSVSVIDLFRFRPGASLATFGSEPRILSSGGDQVFFNAVWESALSTARNDRSGGDGQQPSHWKDNAQSGFYIGVMDPTLAKRTIAYLTVDDLIAFDLIGYRVLYPDPPDDPTELAAEAKSNTSIEVSWRDNSSNESEFRLETLLTGGWRELGGVPADSTHTTVIGLKPGTEYTYRLIATNPGGYSRYTNTATATTLACTAPAITAQPLPQVVVRGAAAVLSVTAGGTAPLTYQWYQGAAATGTSIPGATAPSFTTPPVTSLTAYSVRVSNGCGFSDSDVVTVTAAATSRHRAARR